MKSTSLVVAAILSALALPVFAQTGAAASPEATPKAMHATKHKAAKHAKKADGKTEQTQGSKPAADAATPAK